MDKTDILKDKKCRKKKKINFEQSKEVRWGAFYYRLGVSFGLICLKLHPL